MERPAAAGGARVPGGAPRAPGLRRGPIGRALARSEELVANLALAALVLLPLVALGARLLPGPGLPLATQLGGQVTLWIVALGAALAAREGKLLALATGELLPAGRWRRSLGALAGFVAAAVSTLLAIASWRLLAVEREYGTLAVQGVPLWIVLSVLPAAFALIALRVALRAGEGRAERVVALAGIGLGVWIGLGPERLDGSSPWPWLAGLALAAVAGAPLFVALGGTALVLFMCDGIPPEAVPNEAYRLASSPFLAAVPLFTLAGVALTRGGAPSRLVALFRAALGWLPGGTAIVAVAACAFFTAFTGGSGVTILALGGLLAAALEEEGYDRRFALGLLTGAGSLGLLFPPALPLILYGIAAETPIEDLFLGGLLPGLLMCGLAAAHGVLGARRSGVRRTPFRAAELGRSLVGAAPELSIPLVALAAIFGGFATLVEAAALTAAWTLVVVSLVRREAGARVLWSVFVESMTLLGGVLVILAVAMGLTSWLVDAEVPARLLDWVGSSIQSRLAFLLVLNLFLLAVGCLMDVYSAIFVVVPLVLPLGLAFGIDPVHLGIIFVANLELGYLTPPVGLNLFVASYRFERPLLEVYRASVPMLLILGIGVLLVTYLPILTSILVR